ncbi:hypothetical protein Rhopal_001832-T1 [Rhodotorula paludigena]|uniref:F-box domain-containing protein n=1 Tax=Rhodotorula paludigena TaxID=86838 RepID=A0AAV5G8F7_9BASI|nr:hypothetical protein Rhopal_001832-T1 [Rhodotorula paludigena]
MRLPLELLDLVLDFVDAFPFPAPCRDFHAACLANKWLCRKPWHCRCCPRTAILPLLLVSRQFHARVSLRYRSVLHFLTVLTSINWPGPDSPPPPDPVLPQAQIEQVIAAASRLAAGPSPDQVSQVVSQPLASVVVAQFAFTWHALISIDRDDDYYSRDHYWLERLHPGLPARALSALAPVARLGVVCLADAAPAEPLAALPTLPHVTTALVALGPTWRLAVDVLESCPALETLVVTVLAEGKVGSDPPLSVPLLPPHSHLRRVVLDSPDDLDSSTWRPLHPTRFLVHPSRHPRVDRLAQARRHDYSLSTGHVQPGTAFSYRLASSRPSDFGFQDGDDIVSLSLLAYFSSHDGGRGGGISRALADLAALADVPAPKPWHCRCCPRTAILPLLLVSRQFYARVSLRYRRVLRFLTVIPDRNYQPPLPPSPVRPRVQIEQIITAACRLVANPSPLPVPQRGFGHLASAVVAQFAYAWHAHFFTPSYVSSPTDNREYLPEYYWLERLHPGLPARALTSLAHVAYLRVVCLADAAHAEPLPALPPLSSVTTALVALGPTWRLAVDMLESCPALETLVVTALDAGMWRPTMHPSAPLAQPHQFERVFEVPASGNTDQFLDTSVPLLPPHPHLRRLVLDSPDCLDTSVWRASVSTRFLVDPSRHPRIHQLAQARRHDYDRRRIRPGTAFSYRLASSRPSDFRFQDGDDIVSLSLLAYFSSCTTAAGLTMWPLSLAAEKRRQFSIQSLLGHPPERQFPYNVAPAHFSTSGHEQAAARFALEQRSSICLVADQWTSAPALAHDWADHFRQQDLVVVECAVDALTAVKYNVPTLQRALGITSWKLSPKAAVDEPARGLSHQGIKHRAGKINVLVIHGLEFLSPARFEYVDRYLAHAAGSFSLNASGFARMQVIGVLDLYSPPAFRVPVGSDDGAAYDDPFEQHLRRPRKSSLTLELAPPTVASRHFFRTFPVAIEFPPHKPYLSPASALQTHLRIAGRDNLPPAQFSLWFALSRQRERSEDDPTLLVVNSQRDPHANTLRAARLWAAAAGPDAMDQSDGSDDTPADANDREAYRATYAPVLPDHARSSPQGFDLDDVRQDVVSALEYLVPPLPLQLAVGTRVVFTRSLGERSASPDPLVSAPHIARRQFGTVVGFADPSEYAAALSPASLGLAPPFDQLPSDVDCGAPVGVPAAPFHEWIHSLGPHAEGAALGRNPELLQALKEAHHALFDGGRGSDGTSSPCSSTAGSEQGTRRWPVVLVDAFGSPQHVEPPFLTLVPPALSLVTASDVYDSSSTSPFERPRAASPALDQSQAAAGVRHSSSPARKAFLQSLLGALGAPAAAQCHPNTAVGLVVHVPLAPAYAVPLTHLHGHYLPWLPVEFNLTNVHSSQPMWLSAAFNALRCCSQLSLVGAAKVPKQHYDSEYGTFIVQTAVPSFSVYYNWNGGESPPVPAPLPSSKPTAAMRPPDVIVLSSDPALPADTDMDVDQDGGAEAAGDTDAASPDPARGVKRLHSSPVKMPVPSRARKAARGRASTSASSASSRGGGHSSSSRVTLSPRTVQDLALDDIDWSVTLEPSSPLPLPDSREVASAADPPLLNWRDSSPAPAFRHSSPA